jgi:TolB-like protein/Tfp pilus assembly protein PilF
MSDPIPKRFWSELRRRRVVGVVLIYVPGAWVVAQAAALVLDAFSAEHYLRFVVTALIAGLPVAIVLAWVFDITPSGIQRTPARSEPALPAPPAPEHSIAVLPFANLSQEADNEYFSDGLSEEIRNQLAKVPGLRVAARTSSFAFKGKHEDVREIGRQLNVAAVLEGGVRKQADTVRIYVQLVSATDGYQIWSENFERRLDDIFRLQSEIASAVIDAVSPRRAMEMGASSPLPATQSFDAYNLYLLGRHYFHRRTEPALQRAVECFEEAIRLDPAYALAYSGLADAYTLLSTGYYGNMPVPDSVAHALPAARRALEIVPDLAEAYASLGLIHENQGDFAAAERELQRALELNPGYQMAHVWLGLVLNAQNRHREAAARNREAFRLDPLSPIANTNVGYDALRFGDTAEAAARFAVAMEIDPAFPVPYSGMSRMCMARGDLQDARRWIDRAIERAPNRAFYFARRGLLQLCEGDVAGASESLDTACEVSPNNEYDSDLVIALYIVEGDRAALERVASMETTRVFGPGQRAQAQLALGNHAAARALYEDHPIEARREIGDLINDDWIWRLPHLVNRGHLRVAAGDERGRAELEALLATCDEMGAQGIVNTYMQYWVASLHAVLGRRERALDVLDDAIRRGWRHAWWARHDWNMESLANDPSYRTLLERR